MSFKIHVRRVDWFALGFFATLALVLTGPSLLAEGRNVCAHRAPDTWIHIWAFWRAKYAMAGLDHGYVMSHVVTYPGRILELSAVFDPLLPLLSVPLQWIFPYSTMAFNLLVAFGILFTGFAGYLLTSFLARRRPAGLVGGVVIAVSPFLYRQVVGGFIEYMWWGLLPLTIWLWLRAVRYDRQRRIVAAYLLSLLALFLMSIYCAAWYAVLAVLWLAREVLRAVRGRPHRLARAVRIHLLSAVCLLPVIAFWTCQLSTLHFRGLPLARDFPIAALQEVQADLVAREDAEAAGAPVAPGELTGLLPLELWVPCRTIASSIDLADLLAPGARWAHHRKRGLPRADNRLAPVSIIRDEGYERIFGGEWILVLGLVGLAWMRRRRRADNAQWLVLAAGFLVLGLGPYAVWKGIAFTGLPLPYAWAYKWLPGFSRLMIPARAFLVSIIGLAVVASRGADVLARGLARRTRFAGPLCAHTAIATAMFLFFAWTGFEGISLPSVQAEVPALYEEIAREPGRFALLELPLGGNVDFRMYCQSVHNRPFYKGVVPNFMNVEEGTELIDNDPLVRALNRPEPGPLDPAMVASSSRFLAGQGFRYLLLHADGYEIRGVYESVRADLENTLGPPRMADEGISAWRLDAPGGEHE